MKLNRFKVSANNFDPDIPVEQRKPNANYSWENITLTLDRGAGVYPNRASRDVIIHEYGHALDDEWGTIQDRPYSEGFADALVILMTHQATFGMDWSGRDTFLRKASDPITWEEVQEEPEGGPGDYKRGKVYSGFVWDLIAQFKTQFAIVPEPEAAAYQVAKQLILGAASSDPKDIPDAVRLSFLYDAQQFSGGPGAKSKHFDALAAAAKSRKLPVPPDPSDRTSGLLPH